MLASLKAFGLIAGPLACGILLFGLYAPPQSPGVYVGTRQGVYPISGYAEQPARMFAGVSDKAETAPGTARGRISFFIVDGAPTSTAGCATAQMFFVRVVEGQPPEYRPISTAVERLDPANLCHVLSDELAHWGDHGDPVVEYYFEAKPSTSKPVAVLVVLTVNNSDGSRQIYPVLNYPPSGPRLALRSFQ